MNFKNIIFLFLFFLVFQSCKKKEVEDDRFINITDPSGGETFYSYTSNYIYWNSNVPNSLKIDLYRGEEWVETLSAWAPNNGKYSWYLSSDYMPDNCYKIKVSDIQDESVYDWSEQPFTIANPTVPIIKLISPNGGEHWGVNQSHLVEWERNTLGKTKVYLIYNGQIWGGLLGFGVNANSVNIYFTADLPIGVPLKIRICDSVNQNFCDECDDFFFLTDDPK